MVVNVFAASSGDIKNVDITKLHKILWFSSLFVCVA